MDLNIQEINISNRKWLRTDLTEGINPGPTWGFFVKDKGKGSYLRACQIE